MDVTPEHSMNERALTVVSEFGSVRDVSKWQLINAPSPMWVSISGNVIEVTLSHFENADLPIRVNEFGSVTEVRDV